MIQHQNALYNTVLSTISPLAQTQHLQMGRPNTISSIPPPIQIFLHVVLRRRSRRSLQFLLIMALPSVAHGHEWPSRNRFSITYLILHTGSAVCRTKRNSRNLTRRREEGLRELNRTRRIARRRFIGRDFRSRFALHRSVFCQTLLRCVSHCIWAVCSSSGGGLGVVVDIVLRHWTICSGDASHTCLDIWRKCARHAA